MNNNFLLAFNNEATINHSTKFSSDFKCPDKENLGLYADISTSCQVYFAQYYRLLQTITSFCANMV